MQKTIFTLAFNLCLTFSLLAQNHPTCDGVRYISPVFANVDTTLAVLYGNNNTYAGANQDLFMDIYEPAGDAAAMRPAIVLAFGGSFIGGVREDMSDLCQYYAQRGFVAVTIDYRLYDGPLFPFPTQTQMTDVVIKAVGDMKAAVRYLREDAATVNNYKIDPNMIFVGGISAGGIVANHVAFVDSTDNLGANELNAINNNGGYEGNSSNNTQYSSEVHGVVNYSGALRYAHYIDAQDPPLFSAHDDSDGTVPYYGAMATVFGIQIIYVEGSGMMHPRADSIGVPNFLITIPNSTGHVSYFDGGTGSATWADSVQRTSCQFLFDNVICPMMVGVEELAQQELSANFYPNPSSADMTIQINDLPAAYNLSVFDNMGRLVFQQNAVNDASYTLQKQYFAAGMYYVNIQFEDSKIAPIKAKVVFN